jgi:hypothetical protein
MNLPAGTERYLPITIDATKVTSAMSNFPYQINLSAKLAADAAFKACITTGANIAVWDPSLEMKRPRIVDLDLTNNKLFLAFDGYTSTSGNRAYYVCVGAAISESDSAQAFSNSGYGNRWGFNEFVDGNTAVDSVSGNDGTVSASATLGNSGKFGNSAYFADVNSTIEYSSIVLSGKASFTIELILRPYFTGNILYQYKDGNNMVFLSRNASNLPLFGVYGGAGTTGYATGNVAMSDDDWCHLVVVYDGTQANNADRARIYTNKTLNTLTVAGTFPATAPTFTTEKLYSGRTGGNSFVGNLDEKGIVTSAVSAGFVSTRYDQFYTSGFWTIGSSAVPEASTSTRRSYMYRVLQRSW